LFWEDVVERFVVRAVLFFLICTFVVACRTTGAPPATHLPERLVDLTAQLRLIDGTPVPGAELVVQCGPTTRTARTDREGRLKLEGVPEGECHVVGKRARVNQIIRAGSNLLRGSGPVVLTVKPVYRHTLANGVEIDETLERWNRRQEGQGRVRSKARAWMPLPYRDAPRGREIKKVPLLDEKGQLVTLGVSAQRNLVYLLPCSNKPDRVPSELARLSDHPAAGVSATLIATPSCVDVPLPRQATVLRASDEVLWALSARPGTLVVLDRDAMVLHRSRTIDGTVAFLEKSWPPFAAARQVSVLSSHTVRIAEAARLIAQATRKVRTRHYAAAHGLVDRALRLDPNHAEAHRQLAILKARLGDFSGAMREVSWWRSSFGEESADDLLDEIQQLTASR
jgi:hypothetical protein